MSLSEKRLFLLDMDGTIYLSETIFDGTLDFLNYVKSIGGRYAFLTNNSSRGTDSYIAKLSRMGVEAKPEDFLTSADVSIHALKKLEPDTLFYVCGTESLKNQMRREGMRLADTLCDEIGAVLLGYDTELSYEKLETCCILLMRGVRYYATHPDMVCPTWYGSAPDCGSVTEMLYTCTRRRPQQVFGKPQPAMALAAMEKYGFTKAQTCILGDRVHTDIACGVNAGIDSVFVLSGEGTLQDIEKYNVHPAYIFPNIREFLNELQKENGK